MQQKAGCLAVEHACSYPPCPVQARSMLTSLYRTVHEVKQAARWLRRACQWIENIGKDSHENCGAANTAHSSANWTSIRLCLDLKKSSQLFRSACSCFHSTYESAPDTTSFKLSNSCNCGSCAHERQHFRTGLQWEQSRLWDIMYQGCSKVRHRMHMSYVYAPIHTPSLGDQISCLQSTLCPVPLAHHLAGQIGHA